MPEYEFFVSSGAPQPATKAMRSHAMRTALQIRSRGSSSQEQRQEEQGQASSGSSDSLRTQELKDELRGRFRVASSKGKRKQSRTKSAAVAGPWTAARPESEPLIGTNAGDRSVVLGGSSAGTSGVPRFAGGYIDPFGTLPVPNNSRVGTLVKYYLTRFTLNNTAVDKERPWFSYAMVEPIIMHTTLALVAAFWETGPEQANIVVRREGLYQKGEALRIINTHLQRGEVTDAVIAGVSTLANVAAMAGEFHEADMHASATKRLVEFRGGARVFRYNPTIARSLTWSDIHTAAGLGRPPRLPLIHDLRDITLPRHILEEAQAPDLTCVEALGYGAETLKAIFLLLRQAVLCRRDRIGAPNGIRILLNVADCAVMSHLSGGGDADEGAERSVRSSAPAHHRFRTLLLAAQVFIYAAMRQVPLHGPLVPLLVARLQVALEMGEVNTAAWAGHMSALLWVLLVGAAGAEGGEKGAWFESRLRVVVHQLLQLPDREALERRLRKFVWTDEYCGRFLDRWWDEPTGRGVPSV